MGVIEVRYLLALESGSTRWPDQGYERVFELSPTAEMLPFEPFLSLIRHQCQRQSTTISSLLQDDEVPRRLTQLLDSWLLQSEAPSIEPTNPDQFQFEQRIIRRALVAVLAHLTAQEPLKVLIKNSQYLPVSSAEVLNELARQGQTNFSVDLETTPLALAQWWPSTEPQRRIRQSFTTSALSAPAANDSIPEQVFLEDGALTEQLYWADTLYCGHELQLLAEHQEQTDSDALSEFQLLLLKTRAKTYLQLKEDALTLVNTLKQSDWSLQDAATIESGYRTIYMVYFWFNEFREAYRRAISHEKWAQEHAPLQDQVYASVLRFWAQCYSGNFRFMESEADKLEAQLLSFGWTGLHGLVSASYWYDLQSVPEYSDRFANACRQSINVAIEQKNSLATAKYYHHMSVILQQQGHIEQAIHYLERSIAKSRSSLSYDRLQAGLNGMAFLQTSGGHFDAGRAAILEALPIVISDGNYEQIATTLINGVLTLFYSGDMTGTIALLDDVFNLMHLRGLPNTRFRSSFELKALQALAHYFRGEMEIAVAQYQHIRREPVLSSEGYYFVALMDLVVRCSKTAAPVMSEFKRLLTAAADVHHSAMIELIIRKVIELLQQAKYPLLKIEDNTAKASALVKRHQLRTDLAWFEREGKSPAEENSKFLQNIRDLDIITRAHKESLIDFVKLENALLKLIVETRTISKSCSSVEEFFDTCLKRLMRTVNISYLSLVVDMAGGKQYRSNISQAYESTDHRLPSEYRFSYSEGVGTFSLLIDAGLEVYSADLRPWVHKIIDTLVSLTEEILAEQESSGLAFTDYLTGAYNRAAFERIDQQFNLRQLNDFVLCYLDLDNFKQVNDRFGHARGDQLLKGFVQLILTQLQDGDRVYRIGGDEFLIFMPEQQVAEVESKLDYLIAEMSRSFRRADDRESEQAIDVGCSVGALGIRGYVEQPGSMAKMLQLADHLMYQAKHAGKHQRVSQQLSFDEALLRFSKLNP